MPAEFDSETDFFTYYGTGFGSFLGSFLTVLESVRFTEPVHLPKYTNSYTWTKMMKIKNTNFMSQRLN